MANSATIIFPRILLGGDLPRRYISYLIKYTWLLNNKYHENKNTSMLRKHLLQTCGNKDLPAAPDTDSRRVLGKWNSDEGGGARQARLPTCIIYFPWRIHSTIIIIKYSPDGTPQRCDVFINNAISAFIQIWRVKIIRNLRTGVVIKVDYTLLTNFGAFPDQVLALIEPTTHVMMTKLKEF